MNLSRLTALMIWASRDLCRRPGESVLIGAVLTTVIMVIGTPLLLTEAFMNTSKVLLKHGPSVVVRRIQSGGWSTLPAAEAIALAQSVPGVMRAEGRIWGVVSGPVGALTAVGAERPFNTGLEDRGMFEPPDPGEAVVGPGVGADELGSYLTLQGVETGIYQVIRRLDPKLSIAAHDMVFLHPADARRLLGIAEGQVSDLAVEVFRDEEEEAILPDLARVFPWPVRMVTRNEMIGLYSGGLARRGGIVVMASVPAVLALLVLVSSAVRDRLSNRFEVGLLKALGWTTGDIVQLYAARSLIIGGPAVALGLLAAFALVVWPGVTWPGSLILGWGEQPIELHLSICGAIVSFVEVGAIVLLPWIGSNMVPVVLGATGDPQSLLEKRSP